MKKQAIKEVEHWGNIIWYYFLYNVINDNNYHKEYKINNGAKTYKLNKHNKEVLEYRIYLGVAPNSSLSGFKIRHADYDKKIFDMLNDED